MDGGRKVQQWFRDMCVYVYRKTSFIRPTTILQFYYTVNI